MLYWEKKRRLSNIKIECHWYDSRCSQMQNLTPSRKKSVWCMVISLIVIYCIWMDPYQVRWTLFILCLKDYFGVNYTNCVWMCITLWLCSVSDIFPGIKEDLEWKVYFCVNICMVFIHIGVCLCIISSETQTYIIMLIHLPPIFQSIVVFRI